MVFLDITICVKFYYKTYFSVVLLTFLSKNVLGFVKYFLKIDENLYITEDYI